MPTQTLRTSLRPQSFRWRTLLDGRNINSYLFFENRRSKGARLSFRSLLDPLSAKYIKLKDIPFSDAAWAPYVAAARFVESPSRETLARELRWLSAIWSPDPSSQEDYDFVWPIEVCLQSCTNTKDLSHLADLVDAGSLGDIDDWLAAEKRWEEDGVSVDELLAGDGILPFDQHIARKGFPIWASVIYLSGQDISAQWNRLLGLYQQTSKGQFRSYLAIQLLNSLASYTWERRKLGLVVHPEVLKEIIEGTPNYKSIYWFDGISIPKELDDEWVDFFEWVGSHDDSLSVIRVSNTSVQQIADAYIRNPSRIYIIRTLAALIRAGYAMNVPSLLLKADRFESLELKSAAFMVRFFQRDWGVQDAHRLAKTLISLSQGSNGIIEDILVNLGRGRGLRLISRYRSEILTPRIEAFALALRDELMKNKLKDVDGLINLLEALIRMRTSELSVKRRWRELGLPITS